MTELLSLIPAIRFCCLACKQNVPLARAGCPCGAKNFGVKSKAKLEHLLRERDYPLVKTTRAKRW